MRIPPRFTRALAATAAALALAFPGTARGQQIPVSMAATDAAPVRAATRADALRQRARDLANSPRRWGEVLELRLEAARVAAPDDPLRVADLFEAGVLEAAFGRAEESAFHLQQAAEAALEFGDLFRAGEIFLIASVAARSAGQQDNARHLLAHAEMLAKSPYLPADQCDCLEERAGAMRLAMADTGTLPRARK